MKALILTETGSFAENPSPLTLRELPIPVPGEKDILIKVSACGVCHTELDIIEGRTPPSFLPIVPGHQVVGLVHQCGELAQRFKRGQRVGVAWIFSACGACTFCRSGRENLCPEFRATGRDAHGGYAEYMVVSVDFAHEIPAGFTDSEAAPLLCAGAIGYRSLKLAEITYGQKVGLMGFGASGHLVLKMLRHLFPSSPVAVFSRTSEERKFALELGASWTGDITGKPPFKLDCIIDTTPAWRPVVASLSNLEKGGRLVINAIRKEDFDKEALLEIDYAGTLWMERQITTVANITRNDVTEFLKLASEIHLVPEIQDYGLEEANLALRELKERKIRGAKVLKMT